MKRFSIIIAILILVSLSISAQVKVFNTGKTLIGGTTGTVDGNIQFNLQTGESNGITFNNTTWGQSYKILADDYTFVLRNNTMSIDAGYVLTGIYIGHKNFRDEYGGTLNLLPQINSMGAGYLLYAKSPYVSTPEIYVTNTNTTSACVAIASRVSTTTGMTFASGLNSSNNYNFYVRGDGEAYTKGVLITSDATLKTDVEGISSPMGKILQLRGVEYRFIDDITTNTIVEDDSVEEKLEDPSKSKKYDIPQIDPDIVAQIEREDANNKHMGFLAQEVEQVLPDVVRTAIDGTKAISYIDLIALLVEGMKEQQTTINQLTERVNALEKESSTH